MPKRLCPITPWRLSSFQSKLFFGLRGRWIFLDLVTSTVLANKGSRGLACLGLHRLRLVSADALIAGGVWVCAQS